MFWNRNKIDMEQIPHLIPTSKASLKQQCLLLSNGDIDKAEKLYSYMIKDMDELPIFDPVRPTTMQQIKDTANSTFTWIKENKDDIIGWVDFFRGMFSKGGGGAAPTGGTPLPPINN